MMPVSKGQSVSVCLFTLLLRGCSVLCFEPASIFAFQSTAIPRIPVLLRLGAESNGMTKKTTRKTEAVTQSSLHECKFCSQSFGSRNLLFRHVRADATCAGLLAAEQGISINSATQIPVTRQRVAFQIAYYRQSDTSDLELSEAELASELVGTAAQKALNSYLQETLELNTTVEVLSSTQMSLANQRHASLSQEIDCAAAGDVIILSFKAPSATHLDAVGQDSPDRQSGFMQGILERINSCLETAAVGNETSGVRARVFACKWLPPDQKVRHAEMDCTQRVYHYLLPMRWLPHGVELERWWIEDQSRAQLEDDTTQTSRTSTSVQQRRQDGHVRQFQEPPPHDSIRVFRNVLRNATSAAIPNRRVRRKALQSTTSEQVQEQVKVEAASNMPASRSGGKKAVGRYGLLANKERRPWHNFADPALRGDASPSNEPVWRVLDAAKIIKFVESPQQSEVAAVLEFRGDSFCRQQVRRIVATALAISHDWLSPDTFDIATRVETWLETPLAPAGRLYLEGGRFHFDQLKTGREFFDYGIVARDCLIAQDWMQEALLQQKAGPESVREEELWLETLRDVVSPRVSKQLKAQLGSAGKDAEAELAALTTLDSPPEPYVHTLELLRKIVALGQWPETSVARSAVIGNLGESKSSNKDEEATAAASGSFTVVNPASSGTHNLPRANTLFPDLVDAVFELEEALCQTELSQAHADGSTTTTSSSNAVPSRRRAVSSHCAVNCNAAFTPHVDSGRGAGQSMSMIVGLGDYSQGELGVEGTFHGIRYEPLEFDGWKLRHWTKAYQGERFSLVWFTPSDK